MFRTCSTACQYLWQVPFRMKFAQVCWELPKFTYIKRIYAPGSVRVVRHRKTALCQCNPIPCPKGSFPTASHRFKPRCTIPCRLRPSRSLLPRGQLATTYPRRWRLPQPCQQPSTESRQWLRSRSRLLATVDNAVTCHQSLAHNDQLSCALEVSAGGLLTLNSNISAFSIVDAAEWIVDTAGATSIPMSAVP